MKSVNGICFPAACAVCMVRVQIKYLNATKGGSFDPDEDAVRRAPRLWRRGDVHRAAGGMHLSKSLVDHASSKAPGRLRSSSCDKLGGLYNWRVLPDYHDSSISRRFSIGFFVHQESSKRVESRENLAFYQPRTLNRQNPSASGYSTYSV